MRTSHRAICLGILILLALAGSARTQAAAETIANVTVTLTPYNPPLTVPEEGGTFAYMVEFDNEETASLAFAVWTTLTLPDGGGIAPGYGPVDLLLPGGWSAREDLSQFVAGDLPAGRYTYSAHAGIYPDESWDSDDFEFEKLSGSSGWYAQSPGAAYGLAGVSFVDANTGWAVSTYREIIHTSNGGDIWQQQDDGQFYPQHYNDVHFVDTQTGWVVGEIILHTADAGTTWLEQDSDYDYDFNSVYFVDADHGWAVGGYVDPFGSNHRQVIEHTSDGGDTWAGQFWQSGAYPFSSVHFVDENNGWAVGGPGKILHTTNGGGSWDEQISGTSRYLQSIFFSDRNSGWCVGDGGALLHTSDGGDHWSAQSPGVAAEFKSVFFVDALTGWVAGVDYDVYRPVILHTSDGGLSWQPQAAGTGDGQIMLRDICFVDASHGWIAGSLWPNTGIMLHTKNGGGGLVAGVGVGDQRDAAPASARVSVPYPNPFNPNTRIRFFVSGEGRRSVALDIFDTRGRRIRSLVDDIREPGEHSVEWDGLTDSLQPVTSGVYVYRAVIGDFTTSGKVTLLR